MVSRSTIFKYQRHMADGPPRVQRPQTVAVGETKAHPQYARERRDRSAAVSLSDDARAIASRVQYISPSASPLSSSTSPLLLLASSRDSSRGVLRSAALLPPQPRVGCASRRRSPLLRAARRRERCVALGRAAPPTAPGRVRLP